MRPPKKPKTATEHSQAASTEQEPPPAHQESPPKATVATPKQDEQREPPPAKKPAARALNKPAKPPREYPSPRSNGRYSKGELKELFPNTFSGKLGCVKGVKIHLELDKSVRPVRQKHI